MHVVATSARDTEEAVPAAYQNVFDLYRALAAPDSHEDVRRKPRMSFIEQHHGIILVNDICLVS